MNFNFEPSSMECETIIKRRQNVGPKSWDMSDTYCRTYWTEIARHVGHIP